MHHAIINVNYCHYCNVDFMSFHNVTCCINPLLSRIHVNTTKLLNAMCTLSATKHDIMEFRVYLDTFLSAPTSCRIQSKQLVQDGYQIQIIPIAICLLNFKVHFNILFIYQSEDSCAHEMVIHVSPIVHAIMLTIEPNMVSIP